MSKCALLTMSYNETDFLRMWYAYYSEHFNDADIFILDDGSDPEHMGWVTCNVEQVGTVGEGYEGDTPLRKNITRKFKELLKSYQYVLHADVDEFVVPDPSLYPGGLREFILGFDEEFAQCSGYNVLDIPRIPLDISKRPWLQQRTHWHRDWVHYCKVVLARSDPNYGAGFHNCKFATQRNPAVSNTEKTYLRLIHMHYACTELTRRRYSLRKCEDRMATMFREEDAQMVVRGFANHPRFVKEEIPDMWRAAL